MICTSSVILKIIAVKVTAFLPPDNAHKRKVLQPVSNLAVSERNALILQDAPDLVGLQPSGRHSPEYLYELKINVVEENLNCYSQHGLRFSDFYAYLTSKIFLSLTVRLMNSGLGLE